MFQKFLITIFIAFTALLPKSSEAASLVRGEMPAAPIVFSYEGQEFKAEEVVVSSWHGTSEVPETARVTKTSLDPRTLLSRSVGAKATPAIPTHINTKVSLIYDYITTIAEKLNSQTQEPKITIAGNKAVEFVEPKNGIKLDVFGTTKKTLKALETGTTTVAIIANITKPEGNLSELNSLGINNLLATGISSFKGSPKNRRHNIKVGVEKMTGVIVAPGEIFSFNDNLGPVEADQGFLPELVIKKTGTVPELGGGLCQVSSTVFRAAMIAGLPIVERRNHAYAVQYYAPQGTDATIYPGIVDFRFTNNTNGHILIWPIFTDDNTLHFEFWGTKDDREVVLHTPVQYDRKTDGSMKATWQREVTYNSTTTRDTFKSVYQPPALFHKTEEFVTAAPPVADPAASLQMPQIN